MIAQRRTILRAIERTTREVEEPYFTTGLYSMGWRKQTQSWSEESLRAEARVRLATLRELV